MKLSNKLQSIFTGVGLIISSIAFASTITGTISTGLGNNSGVSGVVISDPSANYATGTYSSTLSVTLTATGSNSIQYTTDGTTPTCSTGTTYSTAISVSNTTTLKAISCYANSNTSSVASYTYAISSGGGGGSGGFSPSSSSNTTTTTNTTVDINALRAIIAQLQARIAALLASRQSSSISTSLPSGLSLAFSMDLQLGSVSEDVRRLQVYLNNHGFKVALTGPGSPNNETTKFGIGTQRALRLFQRSVNISASGFFGPTTRAYINSH